jgi:L-threonine kinase
VDTLAFNRLDHREALRRLAPEHREAFDLLSQGLRAGDLDAVGRAATLSACVHQAVLFNPLLDRVLMLAQAVGALGVCRAHSGTLLGLLLDPRHADLPALAAFVAGCLPPLVTVGQYAMVDGGPRQEADKAETMVANPTCMGGMRG